MRLRLQDFADLTTVVQGLIALLSAGVGALVLQKVGEVFLGLSTFERSAAGVFVFLLLLILFLSRVKAIRERRAEEKSQAERLSAELQDLRSRYERVELKLQEAEQERDRIRTQYDEVRRERDELKSGKRQKRFEEWRSVIEDFDYSTGRFAGTDTYSQMKA